MNYKGAVCERKFIVVLIKQKHLLCCTEFPVGRTKTATNEQPINIDFVMDAITVGE